MPGEDWKLVADGSKSTRGPACNGAGEVFFADSVRGLAGDGNKICCPAATPLFAGADPCQLVKPCVYPSVDLVTGLMSAGQSASVDEGRAEQRKTDEGRTRCAPRFRYT